MEFEQKTINCDVRYLKSISNKNSFEKVKRIWLQEGCWKSGIIDACCSSWIHNSLPKNFGRRKMDSKAWDVGAPFCFKSYGNADVRLYHYLHKKTFDGKHYRARHVDEFKALFYSFSGLNKWSKLLSHMNLSCHVGVWDHRHFWNAKRPHKELMTQSNLLGKPSCLLSSRNKYTYKKHIWALKMQVYIRSLRGIATNNVMRTAINVSPGIVTDHKQPLVTALFSVHLGLEMVCNLSIITAQKGLIILTLVTST